MGRRLFFEILTGDEIWTKITKNRGSRNSASEALGQTQGLRVRGRARFRRVPGRAGVDQGPRVLLTAPAGRARRWRPGTGSRLNWTGQAGGRASCSSTRRGRRRPRDSGITSRGHPEDDAGLLSGTADYELQDMFETPDDSQDPRKEPTTARSAPLRPRALEEADLFGHGRPVLPVHAIRIRPDLPPAALGRNRCWSWTRSTASTSRCSRRSGGSSGSSRRSRSSA